MRREAIVVVGAGPAGCAAAVQCARLGFAPLVIDRTGVAGGLIENGFLVENYPGLESPVPGAIFAGRLREHLSRFGLRVERREVIGISPADSGPTWILETDGSGIEAGCVIAAAGTVPREAGVAGERDLAGDRIFYEVRDLLRRFPSPRRVAVVGGGEAAFDYALSCSAAGARVEILVRGDHPRARGRLPGMVKEAPGVSVRCGFATAALKRRGDGVAAIGGGESDEVAADAILIAVGRRPADIVERLTPRPGLFICGDARTGSLGQAGIAVGDGLEAAAAAVAATIRGRR